jgi:hypothetical protein
MNRVFYKIHRVVFGETRYDLEEVHQIFLFQTYHIQIIDSDYFFLQRTVNRGVLHRWSEITQNLKF